MATRLLIIVVCLCLFGVLAYFYAASSTLPVRPINGEPLFQGRGSADWSRAICDENPKAQQDAIGALQKGGAEAVPVLVVMLEKNDRQDWSAAEVRRRSAEILGAIGGSAAPAVGALTRSLADKDPHVRAMAIASLGKIGPDAAAAAPDLVRLLPTDDVALAGRALKRLVPGRNSLLPSLLPLLKHENPDVRWNAVMVVGKIGPTAVEALPSILPLVKDPSPPVREHAVEALGDIGPGAAPYVKDLMSALADPEWKVRRDAARSLGLIGPQANEAIPALEALSKDPQEDVKQAAAKSIREIKTK